jgi:hypothetical protein
MNFDIHQSPEAAEAFLTFGAGGRASSTDPLERAPRQHLALWRGFISIEQLKCNLGIAHMIAAPSEARPGEMRQA